MHDKNDKLAKENNSLKTIITQRMKTQEELLKRSIKAEYNQILTYRQMLEVLDKSIKSLENALKDCKNIQQWVIKSRSFLADKTNSQNLDSYKDIKSSISEFSSDVSFNNEFQIPRYENNVKEKENKCTGRSDSKANDENILENLNFKKKKKPLLTEKDLGIFNSIKRRKDKKGSNVKDDLFDSWEQNQIK